MQRKKRKKWNVGGGGKWNLWKKAPFSELNLILISIKKDKQIKINKTRAEKKEIN